LSLKLGKFGGFIGCTNYPECRYTRQLSAGANGGPDGGMKKLGADPTTGLDVTLRSGRFGPYVQLGEAVDGAKPKRAGLPRGLAPDDVDLARALGLLSLPREIGAHPDDGEPILAGIGRFGPYVQHGKVYANLEAGDDVLTIGHNRAVTLLAEKVAKGPRGRRFGPAPGRTLGEHPDQGGPVVAKSGRYGPYVSHEGLNATLPSDKTPETITLEEAVALLDARAASGATPRRAKGKAAKSNAPKKAPGKAADTAASPVATGKVAHPRKAPSKATKDAKPTAPKPAKKPARKKAAS
jgi:DNA topoisomerase-1